ncbi:hypothetical protein T484DRAFT_3543206, partial [Baffinella frigidus]
CFSISRYLRRLGRVNAFVVARERAERLGIGAACATSVGGSGALLRCIVGDAPDLARLGGGQRGVPRECSPDSKRSSKWKVTIDPPLEVSPAEVIDGRVFLGNKSHANNLSTFKRLGITHVLNVSRDNSAPWAAHGEKS